MLRTICTMLAVMSLPLAAKAVPASATVSAESWTLGQPALPADAAGPGLAQANAVDCASATFCVVVGTYYSSDGPVPFAAVERGSTWTSTRAALPSGASSTSGAYLADVTCYAVGSCVAVGGYGSGAGYPLIETLSGTTWTAQTIEGSAGGLFHVACGSAACLAVGTTNPMTLSGPLFLDRGSAGRWRVSPVSTPATQPNAPPTISGIACPDTGECRAVGANDAGALHYRRVAGTWTGHYLPMPAGKVSGNISLGSISCPSAQTCFALVPNVDSGLGGLVAEALTAGAWHPTGITLPAPGAGSLTLVAIDCPADGSCAGSATAGTDRTVGLVVRLSGGGWTATTAPEPGDAAAVADVVLAEVSCQSEVACTAVGSYVTKVDDRRVQRPLVETLSGGSWTAAGLGLPDGLVAKESAGFNAVSCVAPRCAATGWYRGPLLSSLPRGAVVATAVHVPAS